MPSTYTLNNGIELIGTGEQSGTWGDTTNINFQLVDTALDGQVSINLTSTGTSGSPNLLEISDGATSSGRNRLVIFTGTPGAADADVFVRLDPNDAEKIIYVRNDLGGTRVIRLFQGTYSASNDYDVPQGTTAVVFFNGAGTGAVAANVFNNAFFDSLRLGGVSVTAILDEDNMSSDSATALATQQSIKKYVDDKAAAQDTLAEVLANGNTSGGTNIQMTTTDELQFRDTALKISSSADGKLDIDADTEIEIVAPTIDIDASTAMTIDTAALTVTGAVDLNTSLNVDGTVTSDGVTVAGNLSVDGGTIKLDGNYPTGTNNVALGDAAGDALASGGNLNVAVGSNALSALVTGDDNVAVGAYALDNVTGADNVGVGSGSLGNSVNSASQNVGLGSDSLTNLASAAYNTAIGHEAGSVLGDVLVATALVSGVNYTIQTLGTTDFTLIGAGSNSVGVSFTATGAGSGTGTASANANYNTFVGHQSGDVIVGGSKNSILGRFDGNQGGLDIRNSDNNIVLSDGDGNPRLAYVSANTELVINEQSADIDFRVESDNQTHMLFVDAGNGRIGINESAPDATFHLSNSQANSASQGMILEGTWPWLKFLDTENNQNTFSIYNDNALYFTRLAYADRNNAPNGGVDSLILYETQAVFNEDSADIDFRVESDNNANMLFVNGGTDRIGIGTSSPSQFVHAQSSGNVNILVETTGDNTAQIQYKNASNQWAAGIDNAEQFFVYDSTNAHSALTFIPLNEVVFNQNSKDVDFRVESDNYSNAFLIKGDDGNIGVNTSNPVSPFVVSNGGASGMEFHPELATNFNRITNFNRSSSAYNELGIDALAIELRPSGARKCSINASDMVVNQDAANYDFRVETDSNANMLFVDGGNNRVGIGEGTPDAEVHIGGDHPHIDLGPKSSNRAKLGFRYDNLYLGATAGGGEVILKNNIGSTDAPDASGDEIARFGDNVVLNESGRDQDFRVESNSNANMLFVDGGANSGAGRVTIGGSNQAGVLTVNGGTTTEQSMWVYGQATGKGGRILSIRDTRATSGTEGSAGIHLTSSPGTDYVLAKYYDGSVSNFMLTDQNGNEYITVEAAANIVINQAGSSGKDFRVESTSKAHMLFIDAAENAVGINDGDPKSYPSGTQTGSATDGGQFRIGGSVGAICASDTGNELAYTRSGLNYISSPNGGFRIRAGTSGGVNLSTTATSWTSASDERLKTLTGDIENAAEKIKTLRTKMGRYNEDPEDVSRPFLIAQDVQAVLPEAVSVIEDDPEIADTTGISDKLFLSYTDVIPLLTAALKESIAKNEELEARITALENA